jgi:protein-disulfide isomerase
LAANAQGSMWEYNDKLFANQESLDRDSLIRYAEEVGMNTEIFENALENEDFKDEVRQDVNDGNALRLRGTPTLFVNGVQYTGAYSVTALQAAIDANLQQ